MTSATEGLRSFYGCALVEVRNDPSRGDRCSVTLRKRAVPAPATFPTPPPSTRLVPPSPYEPLPLGTDIDGHVVTIPLLREGSGGSSVLIGGVPGSGKTTALRVLLAGLAPTTACILVIDPTGGAEAAHWRDRLSAVVDSASPAETIQLLSEVLHLIERRGRLLGAGLSPGLLTPVVLVCDELAELAAAGQPKQAEEARALLRRIVALGRKTNVAVVLATQRTTATSIDVTTRSLVGWRVALAHPDDVHGSEALLGPGHREAAALRKSDVGSAFVTDGGPPQLIRIFDLSPDQALASLGPPAVSLEELEAWEAVAVRELTS